MAGDFVYVLLHVHSFVSVLRGASISVSKFESLLPMLNLLQGFSGFVMQIINLASVYSGAS